MCFIRSVSASSKARLTAGRRSVPRSIQRMARIPRGRGSWANIDNRNAAS